MSHGQAGDLQARVVARVGGEHRGAAGVGHHGDPGPDGHRLGGQQNRGVEQLAEVRGRDHPGLLEQGLPGEQGGSRCGASPGQAPARDGPAHNHGQDRHAAADAAGRAGELGRVRDGLQIQQGQLGRRIGLPPQQHVVAGHVVLIAERDEGGDPDADPRQVLGQGEAGATGRLQRQASASRPGMAGRERRVEAGTGVGHPEAGRPDHPHAVAAADAQQLRAARGAESRREHHQRLDPPLPALFGDTDHGRRRCGDDRQVDLLGQGGRRRDAGHALQFGHGRVNRVHRAGEAAGHDVVQDRPPDRAGPPAGADDRDRGRRQHVPQAGHIGRALPRGHRVTVAAQGDVGLVGGQREGEVVHAVGQGAMRLQPGVGENSQHKRVLAQRLRGEGEQAPAARERDQVFHQEHADTAVVHVIGDRKGDLGRARRGIVALVAAAADQLAVQQGEQRGVVRRGRTADPARLPFGRTRAHAEEAQVETVRGQLLVHVPHRVEVVRAGGPDLDSGAIGQQGVHAGLGVHAHVASPFPRLLRRLTMPNLPALRAIGSRSTGTGRAQGGGEHRGSGEER